jgi:2'-hydroxyisoflavone reductase
MSVYRQFPPGRWTEESAPLLDGSEGYGPLKARSEEAIEAALPGKVAHVRPGLIVGPHDPTDRFTYWPRRVARGGDVLAPGRPGRPVQLIDARDLAEWCVRLAEEARTGFFNAIGPASTLTMERLLETCRVATGSAARFTWVPDDDLIAAEVKPWSELPLWIPEADPGFGGLLLADNRRALAAGLVFRPLADTVLATLDWDRREGGAAADSPIRVTPMGPERETELLARHAVRARS